MIPRAGYGVTGLLILAASFGLASGLVSGLAILPARAQAVPATEQTKAPATETEAFIDPDEADFRDADLGDLQIDWSLLNVDAATLTTGPAPKARTAPRAGANSDMSWSTVEKANGSAAVSVKQPVSPFWDSRIGADMTVTRQPATMSELLAEKAANGGSEPQSSGTAWAAITAPGVATIWDQTAIEARLNPAQDQSKLGTSLSKSLPLTGPYSLTLQDAHRMIQQGAGRSYETEQSARLSLTDTGTSFSAGQTLSSSDDKWLRKIGAEQKLFGGVSISGAISETPSGTASKSISAGFKQSW